METSQALVGLRLEEAARTGFFQWFQLEPTSRPDCQATCFKPSGPSFRELVTVTARTGDQDRIAAIDLVIARSFIEDPQRGMFAADIGKSFLAAALSPPDRPHMQHLIDTIGYGGQYARPILTGRRALQGLEIERQSAPYQVWLGRNAHWRRPFDTVLLQLENLEVAGVPSLRISVSSDADTAAQLSP